MPDLEGLEVTVVLTTQSGSPKLLLSLFSPTAALSEEIFILVIQINMHQLLNQIVSV